MIQDRAEGLTQAGGDVAPVPAQTLVDLLAGLDAGLTVKDAGSGRYLLVSPQAERMLGRRADELLGHTDAEVLDPGIAAALRAADQQALAQGASSTAPAVSTHRIEQEGGRRDLQAVRRLMVSGPVRQILCAWVDVTERRLREAQLQAALEQLEEQQTANEALRRERQDNRVREGMTGLYQRAHFEDLLRREVDLSSREHREFALVSVAIDSPQASDAAALQGSSEARQRVLEALGRLLRSNTRAMDASCRLDEDSFAVLLSGVGLATAHARMEGLRRQCATQIVALAGNELHFTVSMGVASFPHTAASLEDLLQASTSALAEARRRGGNRVALASIRFDVGV